MFKKTKTAIVITSVFVLTACGGGGGGTKPSGNISWGNGIYDQWKMTSSNVPTTDTADNPLCTADVYSQDVWFEKYINGQPTGIKGDFIRTDTEERNTQCPTETTTSSSAVTLVSGTPTTVSSTTEETRASTDVNGNSITKTWKIYTDITTIPITTTVTTTTTRITTHSDGTTTSEVIGTTTTSTIEDQVTTTTNESLLSTTVSPNIVSTSDEDISEDAAMNGTPTTTTTSVTDTRTSTDANGSTVTQVWTVYTDTTTTPITTTTTVTTTRTSIWTDGSTTTEIVGVNTSEAIAESITTSTREEMVSETITPNVVGYEDSTSSSTTTVISDPVLSDTIENTDTREDGVWMFYYDVWTTTTTITTTVTTTRATSYTDGSTTTGVIDTQVTEEITTSEEVTTRVVAPESTPSEPEAPDSNGGTVTQPNAPSLDFDPTTYDYNTYYNNPSVGTPSVVNSNDPADFSTVEADNGSVLDVNANYAYARGWTGKGSTIMIIDTGIDQDHESFTGKIKYLWDAGYDTPYEDENGHGSHVAGIAAGNKDGLGSHGIAYDADIAVAKIGEQNGISLSGARQALDWAKQHEDIVAANISANTNYSNDYKNSITDHGNGVYTNNHVYYGGTNYYNQENPQDWGDVLPSELVLTISAGNYDLGYVQNPATFASAVNANGDLIMDGRMLVVGNWNTSSQAIDGAKSGHVCKDYTTQCNDPYATSDFYILAPGTSINSVQNGGGYTSMSGTSMAAPAVAGGVAIVHQLWPYMQGKNIAQVLLQTANKNINGYNANTHGQGLMDLDQATRPIGNLGISLTGRTGATTSVGGGISFDGIDTSAISSVIAVDGFDRDFTVDLSGLVTENNSNIAHLSHTDGASWGIKYANLTAITNNNYTYAMSDENNYSFGYNFNWYNNIDVNISYTEADNSPWIQMSGIWGETNGSSTVDTNLVWRKDKFWTQLGIMNTNTDYNPGLVNDVDTIHSVYSVMGWDNDAVNLYGGIKPTAFAGKINMDVPSSVDNDGSMYYTSTDTSINNSVEIFAGIGWKYTSDDTSVTVTTVADKEDYNTGVNLTYQFK